MKKGVNSKSRVNPAISEHFRNLGKKGGKSRAKKFSKQKLSEWAKLGGRPKTKV